MTLVILSGILTVSLPFLITYFADRLENDRVALRFLEKGKPYTADFLRGWIADNPRAARGYAFPVLVPLDLLFAVSLAGFTASAGRELAQLLHAPAMVAASVLALPAIYLVADLTEDTLLALMLMRPSGITAGAVTFTRAVTGVKVVTAGGALGVTLVLACVALFCGLV